MLEQQQVWLVNGLQELYRKANEGEGWPGEPLQVESNGHPLTHDLLTRLGALDHSKGEHFEENAEAMQHELWRQNVGLMQRQESSDGSSDAAHSPMSHGTSRFADAFNRHHLPPTPPTYSPSSRAQNLSIKTEFPTRMSALGNPAFATMMAGPNAINPLELQGEQTWSQNEYNAFDDIDMLGGGPYTLSFDDQVQNSPMSFNGRQMPMNCLPTSVLYDPTDDFNQFFNPNTEIPSI
jgi:hypothetical protein